MRKSHLKTHDDGIHKKKQATCQICHRRVHANSIDRHMRKIHKIETKTIQCKCLVRKKQNKISIDEKKTNLNSNSIAGDCDDGACNGDDENDVLRSVFLEDDCTLMSDNDPLLTSIIEDFELEFL